CPMAHCNREDTSYHNLPPLLRVQTIQKVTDPAISPRAGFNLGAFTGEAMAVCAYPSPGYPALVAYDYTTAAVRWTSPLEDLSGIGRRRLAPLLLAKMALSGCRARPYVFAANPTEFVAYTADGALFWRRDCKQITGAAPMGIGEPVALSFTDSRE